MPFICISGTTSHVERNCAFLLASAGSGDGVCSDLRPCLSRVAVLLLLDSGEAFIYRGHRLLVRHTRHRHVLPFRALARFGAGFPSVQQLFSSMWVVCLLWSLSPLVSGSRSHRRDRGRGRRLCLCLGEGSGASTADRRGSGRRPGRTRGKRGPRTLLQGQVEAGSDGCPTALSSGRRRGLSPAECRRVRRRSGAALRVWRAEGGPRRLNGSCRAREARRAQAGGRAGSRGEARSAQMAVAARSPIREAAGRAGGADIHQAAGGEPRRVQMDTSSSLRTAHSGAT